MFPLRAGEVVWRRGQLHVTLCASSKQIVLRQGATEISFPAHVWPEIEQLAAKLVLPKGAAG
jgi:hypothetical protein